MTTTQNDLQTRLARGQVWGLAPDLLHQLAAPASPAEVQDFVSALSSNLADDTCWSVQEVLRRRVAMCLEGAFVAAAALQLQGRAPLLLRLFAVDGEDHAIALFLDNGHWGAISKSNHLWCRWRDPVYRSLRELVMSYLHEYVTGARKTLWAHGDPFDLRRLSPLDWITASGSCVAVSEHLAGPAVHPLFDPRAVRLRPRDPFEQQGGHMVEHGPIAQGGGTPCPVSR